ncbi:hypothetical protein [Streptomyces sp. PanSC9]|uniref:hypothetical protein n=1 Tax=Streptomyces sp. PanSC9 TaxID=1520461 RepID=UPI000F9C060B|nr:hypothetical protein [Streptomyces sp. PanSC9]ROP53300.1 hypothetical protein EDD94_2803 [Streptomyces sp. PanSC9]
MDVIVGYGPEQLQDIAIHDQEDGSAVIETVTVKPIRVFTKTASGSLEELHGEAKDTALHAFWADVERFNNGENRMSTFTLNDLIQTRLTEIAEDAWENHRVMRILGEDGRVIQLGSGAVWERWCCEADHGHGPCHEPLLTIDQAATLVGQPVDFCLVTPAMTPIEMTVLDSSFGFQLTELYHLSDVVAEFKKAEG